MSAWLNIDGTGFSLVATCCNLFASAICLSKRAHIMHDNIVWREHFLQESLVSNDPVIIGWSHSDSTPSIHDPLVPFNTPADTNGIRQIMFRGICFWGPLSGFHVGEFYILRTCKSGLHGAPKLRQRSGRACGFHIFSLWATNVSARLVLFGYPPTCAVQLGDPRKDVALVPFRSWLSNRKCSTIKT